MARLGVNGEANLDPADKMIDRIKSQLVVLTVGIASRMKSLLSGLPRHLDSQCLM